MFQTTRWTLVRAAGEGAGRALGELCTIYRAPLLRHARRRGFSEADAEDAVQFFFARLLRLESLASVCREHGRFRAFLLGAFNHCLADLRDRERAGKRGGGRVGGLDTVAWSSVAADQAGPDVEFDHAWAITLLETTFARLRAEHAAEGRGEWFDTLAPCLAGRTNEVVFAEVAARAGLGEPALRVAVHRLRKRYRQVLREEVAQTVADPREIDAELRHLLVAVSGT